MNIKRGLFRLWIVFSVIWIIIITMLQFNTISNAFSNPPINGPWQKYTQATPEIKQLGDQLREAHNEGNVEKARTLAREIRRKQAQLELDYRWRWRRQVVTQVVFSAILPPAALLAFGLAIAWAMSGFVARKT